MFTWPEFLLKGVQIVFLNLVLSGDNVGVIALAVRGLPPRKARWANLLGGGMAMALRAVFVAALGFILSLRFLHLHLLGGVLLLLITAQMLRPGGGRLGGGASGGSLSRAVASIVAADLSMSFDNALAVASIVMKDGGRMDGQKLLLVALGLAVCVPVIFWGSEAAVKLMDKHPLLVHLCAGLLVYTAVCMLFEDDWLNVSPASGIIGQMCGAVCGALTLAYGALGRRPRAAARRKSPARS